MGKVFKALEKAAAGSEPEVSAAREETVEEVRPVSAPVTEESAAASETAPSVHGDNFDGGGMEQWQERLVILADPASPLSESFRRLRARILHPPSGKPLRKIMLISAAPGAGKSFVCANLGISIAQGLEQHALLVDCDLRRPSLASLFGIDNRVGLADHLRDGVAVGSLIRKTGMRKLSIIPSGPKVMNPAELLGSEKVARFFDEVSNRYADRFVVIDSPPLQAASETSVLVRHVDAVIPVVRWGAGSRSLIKEQLEGIERDKILGIIFNAYESSPLSAKLSGYDEYAPYGGYTRDHG